MKRTHRILGLVAALLLLQVNAFQAFAGNVDRQTATQLATRFLAAKTGEKSLTTADVTLVYEIANHEQTLPALYFFNSKNGGFCVMSANDCVDPVLAYSTEGIFDPENMPENMRAFFQGYVDLISYHQSQKSTPRPEVARMWNELSSKGAQADDPKAIYKTLTSIWDQSYPYNYYTPIVKEYDSSHQPTGREDNAPTGCVATAMAQIIHYWRYPVQPEGKAQHNWTGSKKWYTVKFDTVQYNYDLMPDTAKTRSSQGTIGCFWTQDQIKETAKLNYHCGVCVGMNWSYDGSGAQSSAVAPALKKYYKFDGDSIHYIERDKYPFLSNSANPTWRDTMWLDTIARDIRYYKRPVYYDGYDRSSSGVHAGHAFVAERYNTNNKMIWFNWGWGGSSDCWCNVIKSQLNTGEYNFSSGHGAVVGITPPTDTLIAMGLIDPAGIPTEPQTVALGSIYPNPSHQWVNIPYTLGQKSEALLEIVALDGRVMERRTVSAAANKACVNVQGYPKGIYLCRIDGVTRKFVVE